MFTFTHMLALIATVVCGMIVIFTDHAVIAMYGGIAFVAFALLSIALCFVED